MILTPTSNQRGSILASFLIISLIASGASYFAASHYFVNTEVGLKVYKKPALTFEDTYVDMNSMPVSQLHHHQQLISIMMDRGDARYVPTGTLLEKMTQAGRSMGQAMRRIDDDYKMSDSMRETGRIAAEKYEQLDEKYQLEEKAQAANEKLKEGATRFNNWLKEQ